MRLLVACLLVLGGAACKSRPAPAPESAPSGDTAGAAPAPAPAAAPVTVVELVPGDRGCYLTVAEASGEAVLHLADFDVCEPADLVGKRVTLVTAPTRVQASSCAGNPECTDSETVDVVTGVRPVE